MDFLKWFVGVFVVTQCIAQHKGRSKFLEDPQRRKLPHCNADTFQLFLNELANKNPYEYKIVVLDNGAFHHARRLIIPENIVLLFLPPYSPELNPAENMWAKYKRTFTNRLHKSLDELSKFVEEATNKTTTDSVIATCSFSYIFDGKFGTK